METRVCPNQGHHYNELVHLFNALFQPSHRTILVPGDDEPEYLPADGQCRWNRVIFAHGFYASALHEISHWCIAGARRRQLVDYGYWYEPDGRSTQVQQLFEQVEARPQALEWIFSMAAGSPFNLSLDNLEGDCSGLKERFADRVFEHAQSYLDQGLPERAERFTRGLVHWYGRDSDFHLDRFRRDCLR